MPAKYFDSKRLECFSRWSRMIPPVLLFLFFSVCASCFFSVSAAEEEEGKVPGDSKEASSARTMRTGNPILPSDEESGGARSGKDGGGEEAQPPLSAPSSSVVPWHCGEALYRLEVFLPASDKVAIADDRSICLPAGFDHGVRVYDASGLKMPAHQYPDGGVLLPPVDRDSVLYLYFGFSTPCEPESMPDAPGNERLTLFQSEQRMALTPDQWRPTEISKCNDAIRNTARHSKPWQKCDGGKDCPLLRNVFSRCRNSLMPFCARNVAFRGFHAKSDLYKTPFPSTLSCCKTFAMLPDYALLPKNHFPCRKNQTDSALRNYSRVRDRNLKKIALIRKTDPEDGLEDTLFEAFNGNPRRLESGQIFLPKRPFDTGWRFTVLFRGNLYVPESGEYEFKVKANSTRILRIDGKRVIRSFGETPNTEIIGTEESACIPLGKGIHLLELVYCKQSVSTWISASWRKKGEGNFETLNEENFSPATPAEPLSLSSRTGLRYPLLLRHDKYALFTGKYEKYSLNAFESADVPGNPGIRAWCLNGKEYPGQMNVVALREEMENSSGAEKTTSASVPDEKEMKAQSANDNGNESGSGNGSGNVLYALPDSPDFAPLPIYLPERSTPRIPVRPDLSLKIWAPYFLYEDETLDFYTEIRSRLPLALNAGLKASSGRSLTSSHDVLNHPLLLAVPSLQQEHVDRFAQDVLLKYPMKVDGASFRSQPSFSEFSLFIPGLEFERRKVAVLPLRFLGRLNFVADGFYDGDIRVVPLLHRPTLHDLRAWQLPKAISREFSSVKKVLVIAEDFGSFREDLEKELAKDGVALEFLSWKRSPEESGRESLESLPALFEGIRKSSADTALLIPMTQSRRKTISMRDEARAIAFLLQALRELSSVRSIKLAPPLPQHPDFADPVSDEKFVSLLREFKREYGVDFLELNSDFRKMPDFPSAYVPERPALPDSLFPTGKSQEIAELLHAYLLNRR